MNEDIRAVLVQNVSDYLRRGQVARGEAEVALSAATWRPRLLVRRRHELAGRRQAELSLGSTAVHGCSGAYLYGKNSAYRNILSLVYVLHAS